MRVLYEQCAAVDVGKDVIAVAVRMPGDSPDGRVTVKRTYKTFYGVLREMTLWLASLGVTHVAMESAGSYSPAPRRGPQPSQPKTQTAPLSRKVGTGQLARPVHRQTL